MSINIIIIKHQFLSCLIKVDIIALHIITILINSMPENTHKNMGSVKFYNNEDLNIKRICVGRVI